MTLVQLFTAIANQIRRLKGTSGTIVAENFPTEMSEIKLGKLTDEEYEISNDKLDEILEGSTPAKIYPPNWSEIGYEDTPASIINDFNYAKEIQENWDSSITSMNNKYMSDTKLQVFPLVDISNVTTMAGAFAGSALGSIPLLNTSNVISMNNTFRNCTNLIEVPLINTINVSNFATCFAQCSNLKDIPVLNTSSVTGTGFNNTFSSCPLLSSESLNNILLMCINTKNVSSSYRKLSSVGLTSAQATTCQGLSNYQAFIAAGWTTGY